MSTYTALEHASSVHFDSTHLNEKKMRAHFMKAAVKTVYCSEQTFTGSTW
jgi:hypothetical protein